MTTQLLLYILENKIYTILNSSRKFKIFNFR